MVSQSLNDDIKEKPLALGSLLNILFWNDQQMQSTRFLLVIPEQEI